MNLKIPPNLNWEVLVIDNNSSDSTKAVVESYEDKLPVRYLFEPVQGTSNARNRALDEARGEWLLSTDDDCEADRNWLISMHDAMQKWPNSSYLAGRIVPRFDSQPPSWFSECKEVQGPYALLDLGPESRPLVSDLEYPFGANMAFKVGIARKIRYNTRLGPHLRTPAGGEETELFLQMGQMGYVGMWVPEAVVSHVLPKERLTTKYLWNRCFHEGRMVFRSDTLRNKWDNPRPYRMVLRTSHHMGRWLFTLGRPTEHVLQVVYLAMSLGVIVGWIESYFERRPRSCSTNPIVRNKRIS